MILPSISRAPVAPSAFSPQNEQAALRAATVARPRVSDSTRSVTPLDIATGEIRAARSRQRIQDGIVLALLFSPVWLPAVVVGVSL